MCVPLWNRDRIIGALHVDTPLQVGTFTADDLDLLTALGNFAAVAIERARLQQQIEREGRIRERLVALPLAGRRGGDRLRVARRRSRRVRIRPVTVLFADIVGFTTAAERMEPDALSRFLATFFTFAADAIFAQGGTLDKFIGDAVMAFFGAPIPQADHARRAVAAAAKLVECVDGLEPRAGQSRGEPLRVRADRRQHGKRGRGRHRLGPARRLHGARQHGERRGAARGVRRGAQRDRRRRGDGPPRRRATFTSSRSARCSSRASRRGLPAFRVRLDARGVPLRPRATPGAPASSSSRRTRVRPARRRASSDGRSRLGRPRPPRDPVRSTSTEVAAPRRVAAVRALGVPVLVEDSGLALGRLERLPRAADALGDESVAGRRVSRGCSTRSATGGRRPSRRSASRGPATRPADVLVAVGRVAGLDRATPPRDGRLRLGRRSSSRTARAARSPRWSAEEKNRDSHRARAFRAPSCARILPPA